MENEHAIVSSHTLNLRIYMKYVRDANETGGTHILYTLFVLTLCPAPLLNHSIPFPSPEGTLDPNTSCMDGCGPHIEQVQRLLDFIQVILRDGRFYLSTEHSLVVWECLVEHPVFTSDQDAGFKWFRKVCLL